MCGEAVRAVFRQRLIDFLCVCDAVDDFIGDEKDVEDLPELKPFCTTSALQRAANGIKGFSAAFSAKTTSTDRIIANIKKRSDFQALLQYEELILVAVDL